MAQYSIYNQSICSIIPVPSCYCDHDTGVTIWVDLPSHGQDSPSTSKYIQVPLYLIKYIYLSTYT